MEIYEDYCDYDYMINNHIAPEPDFADFFSDLYELDESNETLFPPLGHLDICDSDMSEACELTEEDQYQVIEKNQIFTCREPGCGCTFTNKHGCWQHNKNVVHYFDLGYECFKCKEKFSSLAAHIQHNKRYHPTVLQNNSSYFISFEAYKKEKKIIAKKKNDLLEVADGEKRNHWSLKECLFSFALTNNQSSCSKRSRKVTSKDSSEENVLTRQKNSNKELRISKNDSRKNKKVFICNEFGCQAKFALRKYLNGHKKNSHDLTLPYVCKSCWRAFSSIVAKRQHIKKHHAKITKRARTLPNEKKRKFSEPQERIYSCTIAHCIAAYTQKRKLEEHLKQPHDQSLPYVCKLGKVHFSSRASQIQHNKVHHAGQKRRK